MAVISPRTWVQGELVTPLLMNTEVRDHIGLLHSGSIALTSQAAGDLITASGVDQLGRLPAVAAGQFLVSNGVGVPPVYTATPSFSNFPTLDFADPALRFFNPSGVLNTRSSDIFLATNGDLEVRAQNDAFSAPSQVAIFQRDGDVNSAKDLIVGGTLISMPQAASNKLINAVFAMFLQLDGVSRIGISATQVSIFHPLRVVSNDLTVETGTVQQTGTGTNVFAGPISLAAGTVTAPSLRVGDADTGIFRDPANLSFRAIDFAVDGVHRAGVGSSGATFLGRIFMADLSAGGGDANLEYITATGELAFSASSRRFKENEELANINPAAVMALTPKTFSFKGKPARRLGFIAEDVAEVMPEAVSYDSMGRPTSINEQAMLAYLVTAIQELRK